MDTHINTAIWLDSDNAYILNTLDNKHELQKVVSNVEHHVRYDGETDSASRFGNQYIDTEKKIDERRKQQDNEYFKEIIKKLPNPDQITICGPSLAKTGLVKEINKIKSISPKLKDILITDSMTENQIIAFLKKCNAEKSL